MCFTNKTAIRWYAAVCACVIGLAGCASPSARSAAHRAYTVYLVSHGWHAGIVLPWTTETARSWPAGLHVERARFVEVGWGERDYYPAPGFPFGLALKALFWRNDSVLHIVGVDVPVERYFAASERVALGLSAAEYGRLTAAIAASFALDAQGRAQRLGPGLYGDSAFYLSRERYHLFRTCNVWTARRLKEAGLPFRPIAAFSTGSLLEQARKIGQQE